jgi:glycosyltransferase involved in cell wall biosynthesis
MESAQKTRCNPGRFSLKITAIEPSGNLYGSEYCLLDVIEGTSSRGFEWDVVLPRGGGFDALLEKRGIRATYLLPRKSHTLGRSRKLMSYWRVRQHLAREKPAVIYVNQAGILRGVNAISRGTRLPIVCQVQTLEDAQFIAANRSDHQPVSAFICNSHFTASAAGIEEDKLCVLYQPAMTSGGVPASAPPPPAPPWRVGILGRIAVSKGHYVFLEAAKQLLAGPNRDVRFVVIGEGLVAADTDAFYGAVERSGMSQHFELRGYRTDVASELARLHLVVIPSIAEPLGRVLLDACVANRPAIVSDSGGLGEFSRHFDVGRRFRAEDSEDLARNIDAALNTYEHERALFEKASQNLLRRLAPRSYIDTVSMIIENAARGKPTAVEWLGDAA